MHKKLKLKTLSEKVEKIAKMINMTSNSTNLTHFMLYDHRDEENDAKMKEWADKNCYEEITEDHHDRYMQFEQILNTFNCTFATLGLIGNILSVMVLCRKEMRKNCFSQLLIGKKKENQTFLREGNI